MNSSKKFIAPGGWFEMSYPVEWNEFEDQEGSFLFYNPDQWTGNFRISAFRGATDRYAEECMKEELKDKEARLRRSGQWDCVYKKEVFDWEDRTFVDHCWLFGEGDLVFECRFTLELGNEDIGVAEEIVSTVKVRPLGQKFPLELIPVRALEIYRINEAYEWVCKAVKEHFKLDFQGSAADIGAMQRLIDEGRVPAKKKEQWMFLGLTLCVVWLNEVEGWEWRTLIDGNREDPVILELATGRWVDPMKLTWSKVKAGEKVCLLQEFDFAAGV